MNLTIVVALAILSGSAAPANLLSEQDLILSTPAAIEVQQTVEELEQQERLQWVRNILLPEEEQEYLWELCEEHGLDYDLMLSVMYHESRYNPDARNLNKNGTTDSGYMQINSSNKRWVNELANKTLDLTAPKDSILAGVLIFKHYRDYWIDRVDEDSLNRYTLNSYNMGIGGYTKAGFPDRSYNRKVEKTAKELSEKYTIIVD